MSQRAEKLFAQQKSFDPMRDLQTGLSRVVAEVGAELSRLGVHGSMEFASALHTGNGFVAYGPGQYTQSPEYCHWFGQSNGPEHGQEFGQQRGLELEMGREL